MSQKSSFKRILDILKRLNDGKKVRISHIVEDYEVDKRTVYRDFELIKEVFNDFLLKEGDDYFAVNKKILNNVLSGTDLATLTSIVDIFKSNGSEFKLDNKLSELYSKSKDIYKLDNKPFEDLKNREIIEEIEKAIKYNEYITIEYKKIDVMERIHLKPYKIILLNENFYLGSANDEGNSVLSRVGLIKSVTRESTTFYEKPQMKNFFRNIQTPFATFGNEDVEIVVTVPKNIARYFKMKKYLPSQRILEEREDGSLKIKYVVSNLREIKSLVLQWIPKMEIVSPLHLKKVIKKELISKLESVS